MNWGADNLANVVDMRNQSASDMVIAFSSTCCCDEKEWSAPSNVSVILITSNQFSGEDEENQDAMPHPATGHCLLESQLSVKVVAMI